MLQNSQMKRAWVHSIGNQCACKRPEWLYMSPLAAELILNVWKTMDNMPVILPIMCISIFLLDVLLTSLRQSDAYMRQFSRQSLVQRMTCHLIGAKPLCEPMLTYCHIYHRENISIKYQSKFKKMSSAKWRPLFLGLNMLKWSEQNNTLI